MLLAIAAEYNMEIDHMDVITAFLNGDLKEQVYMEQPEGFEIKGGNGKVYKLNKAIYGLKQAAKSWYDKLDTALTQNFGFKRVSTEPCVYFKSHQGKPMIISIYVDDILLFTSCSAEEKKKLKDKLMKEFAMRDLGAAHHILGMKITNKDGRITLDQSNYIQTVLNKFQMSDCKPASTPMEAGLKLHKAEKLGNFNYRNLIGCLMYVAVCTRPDIAYAVSSLSQFNQSYAEVHWKAAKRVLRYLKGTINHCLTFEKNGLSLTAYVDADWAASAVDRKSYTGYVFKIGNNLVSWESRKQKTVALSSTEAEYMALSDACKEALFIRSFLHELLGINVCVTMYNDNQSAQKLSVNQMYHSRTKHIDVRHHFIRQVVSENAVQLKYCPTDEMPADLLTKPLPIMKHNRFVNCLLLDV
ncbi:hypothetical protein JYU34_002203 [Plutella xylostella]|uniref:Reverse transcriptase Ty1/copia-type domain-containing protein n=1 Tax=Plutella xylostella TaxID=51655 RepID=A0ABQ7QBF5_PLUXY|nr:hypothetical protein JYU34_012482 [Plutella xylostella]KAG7308245.1 hypothetical protein JYU34_006924 [Plutella xylostella]KAG7311198.1 hypothetical protein JYU34_002203 [Plutella xylostella]